MTTMMTNPAGTPSGGPNKNNYDKGIASRRRLTIAILLVLALVVVAVALVASSSSSSSPPSSSSSFLLRDSASDDEGDGEVVLLYSHLRQLRRRILIRLESRDHKKLLPLDSSDYAGFLYATLGLMIAAGGGIGGGGVLVPIYILIMKFTPKYAIPLSNVTVLGGAIANTLLSVKKRHPLVDRPLVDWDLILVMEPLTIAGALMGAFLNKLLPEAILVVLLVALLSFTAYETLKKAIRMYRAETKALLAERGRARVRDDGTRESELARMAREMDEVQAERDKETQVKALLDDVERNEGDNPGNMVLPNNSHSYDEVGKVMEGGGLETGDYAADEENDVEMIESQLPHQKRLCHDRDKLLKNVDMDDYGSSTFSSATDLKNQEDLSKILEEERHVPMGNVQVLCLTLAVVVFINLIKGGGSSFPSPLGIQCGSLSFWVANSLMLVWTLLVIAFARSYLIRRHEIKSRVGYTYVEGDIEWDRRATVVFPLICTSAGFFAGMFGVGGGIVTGPLMLAMGVHPKVSSATNAVMILFTSFPVTTSFIVFGLLDMEYAGVCLILGFTATLVGQWGLFFLMQKYQRNSYIAFSIGGIVLLSAFLMTIQSLIAMADSGGPRPPAGLCTVQ
ncbi:hypothetical protein ACHAXA_009113 [Cyclostephanos tholiformis]|uniref:Sulfite exporter TauE/SafE family protein n=1 Tax=Cyclostephanos tholiformis TaxID=382380 RepID=A0ABD3RXI7_9STRA